MGTEYNIDVNGGGSISGPIAMGDHASATVNNVGRPPAAEAERLLARLEQLIERHAASLDAPHRDLKDVADVRHELRERRITPCLQWCCGVR